MKDIVLFFGGTNVVPASPWIVVLAVCITNALPLVFYILRSIGVYVLSKRENIKHAWLAWLPLLWVLNAGKLMGKVMFGGKEIKWFSLVLFIAFALSELILLFNEVIGLFPLVGYYLQGGEIYFSDKETYEAVLREMGFVPYYFSNYEIFVRNIIYPYNNMELISRILDVIYYVDKPLGLITEIGLIIMYIGVFRKYYPEHYLLATILSIFGLFGPFIFAVRKRKAVNYNEYMRNRFHSTYGMYQNPYTQNNPYNQRPNNTASSKRPASPFEEFEDDYNKRNPFEEFDEDKKE